MHHHLKARRSAVRCSWAQLRWRWLKLKISTVLTVNWLRPLVLLIIPQRQVPVCQTRAARHHGIRHHRMYMMSVNRTR